ncbi:protein canopy 4-like [Argonauta hians]
MNCEHVFVAAVMLSIFAFSQTVEVTLPSLCEVCKYLTVELQSLLSTTEKSKFVLETGHGLDTKKKRIQYQYSELRLTEALHEPHICDRLLKYNVHNEKKGSLRFAKGRSETLKTLHGLREKGVKVELGIPEDLWDTPSVEVSDLHRKCIRLVEDHEPDIEDWYFGHQGTRTLQDYLCKNIVLLPNESGCLAETEEPQEQKNLKGEVSEEKKSEL